VSRFLAEEGLGDGRSIDAQFLDEFRRMLDRAAERLLVYNDEEASRRPAPGKWSRKEIVGHLIDSASNNHGRFVRAQLQDDLVFPGYDQDRWVQVQRYQSQPWADLVRLWHAYNRQIAYVMEVADPEAVERLRPRHNLHELAWKAVPVTEPATLAYFMRDYVDHLEHHLRQAGVVTTT
jgi:hypothetical protein